MSQNQAEVVEEIETEETSSKRSTALTVTIIGLAVSATVAAASAAFVKWKQSREIDVELEVVNDDKVEEESKPRSKKGGSDKAENVA